MVDTALRAQLLRLRLLHGRLAASIWRVDTVERSCLRSDLGFGLVDGERVVAIVERHKRVAGLDRWLATTLTVAT